MTDINSIAWIIFKAGKMLELIGKKRGFLIKGGEIDYERTADYAL